MMIGNITVLLEVFALLYCLAECFGHKLRFNIYVIILEMIAMFLSTAITDYGFPTYFMSIYYISLFLYALAYYGEGVKRALINLFLAFVIMMVIQLTVFFPSYYLLFNRYEQGPINELLINILCAIIIILISSKTSFKKLSDFFWKRNKLLTVISVLIFMMIWINFQGMKDTGDIIGETYIQLMFFFFIFAFIIYEWQKSRMDAEKKKTQLDMNALYYDAYDQLILLIRERQHDMKNHINTIMSMIYTIDDYDELVAKQTEYCNQIIERNEKTRLVLNVANPLIAGFLYSKIQDAEKNEIELEYRIDINETAIVMPEYELIEMASVLIDNAIEALCSETETVKETVQIKKIYISMKETEENLELIVANTSEYLEEDITEYFFETGYSSKGKGRGIGLSKLKRIVHEKMGDIIVSNEKFDGNNYLQFCIVIPANAKGSKNSIDVK